MHEMMNSGAMWGLASPWFLICIFVLIGAAALVTYLLFFRRE